MTVYAQPGAEGSKVTFKDRYENWIGGEWVAPVKGAYFENITPVTGKAFCEVARGTSEDIELALDAAHKVAPSWGKTSATERAAILNKIADRIDENVELLAVAETWDNGKPVRETLNADIPLAADHFRYFASAVRAQEGHLSQLDDDTTAYHFKEPLGVVGQIIPWNFPILMAVWKLAPALAAGNAVVLKPAEQTPTSILVLMELIGDLLPAGVVNVVNGFGVEAGAFFAAIAVADRFRRRRFHGRPAIGQQRVAQGQEGELLHRAIGGEPDEHAAPMQATPGRRAAHRLRRSRPAADRGHRALAGARGGGQGVSKEAGHADGTPMRASRGRGAGRLDHWLVGPE